MNSLPTLEANINNVEMIFDEKRLSHQLNNLIQFVKHSASENIAIHEVERGLWSQLLELGHQTLGLFLQLSGNGDEGDQIVLSDGHPVNRLKAPHPREYQSVFGEFTIERFVYGSREGQKIEYVPLDEQLQLPNCKFSYLLQDWDQSLAVEMPFKQVNEQLSKLLGFNQSVNSLERINQSLAAHVDDFWAAQTAPPANEEGRILVVTADGKGVTMRGQSNVEAFDGIESEKPKRAGKKKMALLGAAYTIDPFVRTPEDVLNALFRSSQQDTLPSRPKPMFKHVRACLLRNEADTTQPQVDTIFDWLAQEVNDRNPTQQKPVVLLMDGQESLWQAGLGYLPETMFDITEILDLLHAASYVWDAAHLFHPRKSQEAADFAKQRLDQILQGKVHSVVRGLRWQATHHKLKGKKQKKCAQICTYFKNNAHRMDYQSYLAEGYPIASGVIEGACRNVVNDRMERTGMRWSLEGAHAMLGLRSIQLSQLWDDFMHFCIEKISNQLYPHTPLNKVTKTVPDIIFRAANDEDLMSEYAG